MASKFRESRPDGRVILRVGAYFAHEPQAAADERGRHALAGPPDWLAARLREYVDAGCDGFVLNLEHRSAGLAERVHRFAEEVAPLLTA